MKRMRQWLVLAMMGMVALAGVGCTRTQVTVQYDPNRPGEPVPYSVYAYQFTKSEKVQIVLARRPVAPAGTPEASFEYVYFELPDRDRYGWLLEDKVPVYRWVHESGHDTVWLGTAGDVRMSAFGGRESMGFDFRITMDPLLGDGKPHIFSGTVHMSEDLLATQGLINRYGLQLMKLLGQKPKDLPPTPASPKKPPTPKTGPPEMTVPGFGPPR
jgi:hypothetical protein